MALYLGSKKQQINVGNTSYYLNLFSTTSIVDGIQLLSLEGYILKDSTGLYLTAKEDV